MTQPITSRLTAEEFLTLPEEDIHYELINGQAIPKDDPMSPKRFHSRLQPILWQRIEQWCSDPECVLPGSAYTEWALLLKRQGEDWIPLPDITFISNQRLSIEAMTDEACPVPPELVVEIISAGQTFKEMAAKAADYLMAGVDRVWIVDPKARSITVFYPDAPPQTYRGEMVLTDSLLPDLQLIPQQVFQQAKIP